MGTKVTKMLVNHAFKDLRLHKVTAEILSENIASEKMITNCGFTIDGRLRDDIYKNNRFYDVLCASILEND